MRPNAYLCRLRRSCPHVPHHLTGHFDPVPTGPARAQRRATKATAALGAFAVCVPAALAATSTVASAEPPPAPAPASAPAPLPTGAGKVLAAPIAGMAADPQGNGYWEVGGDGGVFAFGDAGYFGSAAPMHLDEPVVGMTATPDGQGYWLVGADGGVFAFGDAGYFGSAAPLHVNRPVVGMTATPDGQGYWLTGADGGVFAFGDAGYYGSAAGQSTSPIVGLAPSADGHGYWEASAEGAVYSFGDAAFSGRATPATPIVGITASGSGYRLVGADGGVLDYGNAAYYGSMAGQALAKPVVGMAETPDGAGYWEVGADGGIFNFGDAVLLGSLGGSTLAAPPASPAPVETGSATPGRAAALPMTAPAASQASAGGGPTSAQMAAWERVNTCEEGGSWNADGANFSGGLGMSHAAWSQFNTFGYPTDAAHATPAQQVQVAVAFASHYYGNPNAAPDQNGCSGGY